jgi:hypothetical protein
MFYIFLVFSITLFFLTFYGCTISHRAVKALFNADNQDEFVKQMSKEKHAVVLPNNTEMREIYEIWMDRGIIHRDKMYALITYNQHLLCVGFTLLSIFMFIVGLLIGYFC